MSAVTLLDPQPGERVLDLCAAPGGKTTDLAASLREVFGDAFVLVSNEVMKQRAAVLADNAAIWGDPNVIVTSDDPRAFSSLPGFFDIVVADVPCSGEGMFRKNEEAKLEWSPENVQNCAKRQDEILDCAAKMLRRGGRLVYSTCTFAPAENETAISATPFNILPDTNLRLQTDAGFFKYDIGYLLQ